jgi:hypothetical protein
MSSADSAIIPTTVLPPTSAATNSGEAQSATAPGGGKSAEWKDNNPKDGFGILKAGITSYLWMPVLMEQTVGMAAGAFKYGAHNYLVVAPRSSVYTDAAIRHISAFVGGEMFDPHAGKDVRVRHIVAAMNSLHVLAAAIINDRWIDDRPPVAPPGHMESLESSYKAIAANNPEPVARYLADGKRGPGRILAPQPPVAKPWPAQTQAAREADARPWHNEAVPGSGDLSREAARPEMLPVVKEKADL